MVTNHRRRVEKRRNSADDQLPAAYPGSPMPPSTMPAFGQCVAVLINVVLITWEHAHAHSRGRPKGRAGKHGTHRLSRHENHGARPPTSDWPRRPSLQVTKKLHCARLAFSRSSVRARLRACAQCSSTGDNAAPSGRTEERLVVLPAARLLQVIRGVLNRSRS